MLRKKLLRSQENHFNLSHLTGIKCPVRTLENLSAYLAEIKYPRDIKSKTKTSENYSKQH